jgi:hypothetical protein
VPRRIRRSHGSHRLRRGLLLALGERTRSPSAIAKGRGERGVGLLSRGRGRRRWVGLCPGNDLRDGGQRLSLQRVHVVGFALSGGRGAIGGRRLRIGGRVRSGRGRRVRRRGVQDSAGGHGGRLVVKLLSVLSVPVRLVGEWSLMMVGVGRGVTLPRSGISSVHT